MTQKNKLSSVEKIRLYKQFNHEKGEILLGKQENHLGGNLPPKKEIGAVIDSRAGADIGSGVGVGASTGVGSADGVGTMAVDGIKKIGWMIGQTQEDEKQEKDEQKDKNLSGGLRINPRKKMKTLSPVGELRKNKKSLLFPEEKKLKIGDEVIAKKPFSMSQHMWKMHRYENFVMPLTGSGSLGMGKSSSRLLRFVTDILRFGAKVAAKSNPISWMAGVVGFVLIPVLFFIMGMMIITSTAGQMGSVYPSSKEMLIALHQAYSTRELNLQNEINRLKDNRPGYDDYKVEVDGKIGHDPHVLLSFLSVMKGPITDLEEIDGEIGTLFYILHKTSYDESVSEDGKKIMTLKVSIKDLPAWIKENLQGLPYKMYESLFENKGGYKDLFNQPSLPEATGSYQFQQGGNLPPPDAGHVAKVNGGWPGQCTWYVYNRFSQLGHPITHSPMGNGGEWAAYARGYGYPVSHVAKPGTALCFPPGIGWSDPIYGHIAFCERVNEDGSVYLTEMNVKGEFVISDRTISADVAAQCWYIDFGLKVN